MNTSIYSADRDTHLRIVAMALLISIAIVGFAVSTHVRAMGALQASAHPAQTQKAETGWNVTAARTEQRRI